LSVLHLVAHLGFGRKDLAEYGVARRVWDGMRRAFPDALAGTVMPDHVHLVADEEDPDGARRRLGTTLSRATYGRGRRLWLPVPEPDVVREPKLRRVVRYVALNPCRRGLADTPLEWVWNSHRDVMGAAVAPWVLAEELGRRLGYRRSDFRDSFHRYVSSDRSVRGDDGAAPRRSMPSEVARTSLLDIEIAAAAALRGQPEDIRRRGLSRQLFVNLAWDQGWSDSAAIARRCETTTRAVQRCGLMVDREAVEAAAVCLGDERLMKAFRIRR
jgi:hypothetical protein